MGKKNRDKGTQKKHPFNLKERMSILVIVRGPVHEEKIHKALAGYECPVFWGRTDNSPSNIGSHVQEVHLNRRPDGSLWPECQSIATPWVLILEQGEFLEKKSMSRLEKLLQSPPEAAFVVAVQHFLPSTEFEPYEWVSSVGFGRNLDRFARSIYHLEPRLVPGTHLDRLHIIQDESVECGRLVEDHSPGLYSDLVIAGTRTTDRKGESTDIPSDRDIFLKGHMSYFDDMRFSIRFDWPGTSYATVRFEHMDGIVKGLDQGLTTPEIANQAISYLMRFGHFEQAYELSKKIPEEWRINNIDLTRLSSLAALGTGRKEEAAEIIETSDLDECNSWINIINLARTKVLLGQDESTLKLIKDSLERIPQGHEVVDQLMALSRAVERNKGERATLSICLIVRNEDESLPHCLGSTHNVADETIVVDTGSRDNTVQIAEEFGARVYSFPWTNDFSAARNFAIEKAECDYILMIDADEYIPPDQMLNLHVLKAMLPTNEKAAFRLTIAHIQTRHNWLVFVRAINPRIEKECVRIFPRMDRIRYRGTVEEEIESSLVSSQIPVFNVATKDLYILHDPFSREKRVSRKLSLFDRVDSPDFPLMCAALRDFSAVNDVDSLVTWLHRLNADFGALPVAWPYTVQLARFLEQSDPDKAENIYRGILKSCPDHVEAQNELARLLVNKHRIHDLANLILWNGRENDSSDPKERLDNLAYRALSEAYRRRFEDAASYLNDVLSENPIHLLGQTVRFYILMGAGDYQGAVAAIDDIFHIMGTPSVMSVESLSQILVLVEKVSGHLRERNAFAESNIMVAGGLWIENMAER